MQLVFCLNICEEWYNVLATCWKHGSKQRLHALCDLLIANDFFSWYQLDHAVDPDEWAGVENMVDAELEFLRGSMRIGKHRPRHVVG